MGRCVPLVCWWSLYGTHGLNYCGTSPNIWRTRSCILFSFLNSVLISLDPFLLPYTGGSDSKESACNVGDRGSGLGRSPGEGNSYTLQYSCLKNPMDRGASWATVHGAAKTQTGLGDFQFHTVHFRVSWFGSTKSKLEFDEDFFEFLNQFRDNWNLCISSAFV